MRVPLVRQPPPAHLLERVLRLWAERGDVSLDAAQFDYLGAESTAHGDIFVYRHRVSRRCLNLDRAGHAYRYLPRSVSPPGSLRYLPIASLDQALRRLAVDGD